MQVANTHTKASAANTLSPVSSPAGDAKKLVYVNLVKRSPLINQVPQTVSSRASPNGHVSSRGLATSPSPAFRLFEPRRVHLSLKTPGLGRSSRAPRSVISQEERLLQRSRTLPPNASNPRFLQFFFLGTTPPPPSIRSRTQLGGIPTPLPALGPLLSPASANTQQPGTRTASGQPSSRDLLAASPYRVGTLNRMNAYMQIPGATHSFSEWQPASFLAANSATEPRQVSQINTFSPGHNTKEIKNLQRFVDKFVRILNALFPFCRSISKLILCCLTGQAKSGFLSTRRLKLQTN